MTTALGALNSLLTFPKLITTSSFSGASSPVNLNSAADVTVWTSTISTAAITLNSSGTQKAGDFWIFIFTSDATGGRVITFGTGFKSTGTLTTVASKISTIWFATDGTNWCEMGRVTAGM